MNFIDINGRRYAQFRHLVAHTGLRHGFTTRPQNVSPKPGPHESIAAQNRDDVAADFGFPAVALCYCRQTHEPNIAVVTAQTPRGVFATTDGLITDQVEVPLMTFSADCPLVLVFDPANRVLGMVHSSWRCTVANATRKLVERMISEFNVVPSNLRAGIGPSAGPDNYEVGADVYEAAAELPNRDDLFHKRAGKLYFDLWNANRVQLQDAGVLEENIEIAEICTMDRTDLFYSYRREGVGCGHFGLIAGIVAE